MASLARSTAASAAPRVRAPARGAALIATPRPAMPRRVIVAHFTVTMRTPEGDTSFECPPDRLILDAAEEAGVELPFLCRTGTCMGCTARRVEGKLEQRQDALAGEAVDAGFALLCQSYPRSDLVIKSHAEQDYWLHDAGADASASSAKTSSR